MKRETSCLGVSKIEKQLKKIVRALKCKFHDNVDGLVLYGSWVSGKARKDSDIDLLAVFKKMDKKSRIELSKIGDKVNFPVNLSIVSTSVDDFEREKLPLYTAVKREGKIIYGKVDLSLSPASPETKYAEFFRSSAKFESQKIRIAEEMARDNLFSGVPDLCYLASKHALQAALAMKDVGFSSKFVVLLPLAERYFKREIAEGFRILFRLYVKSEYQMEGLDRKQVLLAIKKAKNILKELYSS